MSVDQWILAAYRPENVTISSNGALECTCELRNDEAMLKQSKAVGKEGLEELVPVALAIGKASRCPISKDEALGDDSVLVWIEEEVLCVCNARNLQKAVKEHVGEGFDSYRYMDITDMTLPILGLLADLSDNVRSRQHIHALDDELMGMIADGRARLYYWQS